MPTISLNKFDGGQAEDVRTFATDQNQQSLNFDVFTNPHLLIPYPDSIAETTGSNTMADIQISDIDISLVSSSYLLNGVGYQSNASNTPTIWNKTALTNGGTLNWTSQQVGGTAVTFQKGSGVVYKDSFYALGYNGSGQYTLFKYTAGSFVSVGTISSSSTFYARPFVHPEDNLLYIAIGTTMTVYNGTDNIGSGGSSTVTTLLKAGYEVTSLTDYGTYLAITERPLRGNGNSIVYLWGRDITLNTFQGTINFGEGNLIILENLNNSLFAVMLTQNIFSTNIANKIVVKGYSGGAVETIKSLSVASGFTQSLQKVKNDNKLYFGFGNDYATYCFGKNKGGEYILTQDKFFNNGTVIGGTLYALQMIGDVLWKGFSTAGSVYTLMRSMIGIGTSVLGETATYNATSIYKTTMNPSMPIEDRYKFKQLDSIQVSYTAAPAGAGSSIAALKYSIDGSTLKTIISDTQTAGEYVIDATNENDGTVFLSGKEIQFQIESTGGAKIKEIKYRYTVLNSLT